MRRSMLRSAAVVMTAGALIAVGTSSALAGTTSSAVQVVNVVGNGSSVHLSTSSVKAGTVRFNVSTRVPASTGSGSEVTLFKLKNGATLSRLLADFKDEFTEYPSIAARGTP